MEIPDMTCSIPRVKERLLVQNVILSPAGAPQDPQHFDTFHPPAGKIVRFRTVASPLILRKASNAVGSVPPEGPRFPSVDTERQSVRFRSAPMRSRCIRRVCRWCRSHIARSGSHR